MEIKLEGYLKVLLSSTFPSRIKYFYLLNSWALSLYHYFTICFTILSSHELSPNLKPFSAHIILLSDLFRSLLEYSSPLFFTTKPLANKWLSLANLLALQSIPLHLFALIFFSSRVILVQSSHLLSILCWIPKLLIEFSLRERKSEEREPGERKSKREKGTRYKRTEQGDEELDQARDEELDQAMGKDEGNGYLTLVNSRASLLHKKVRNISEFSVASSIFQFS